MKISRENRKLARELFHLSCDARGHVRPERVRQIADGLLDERPVGLLALLREYQKLVRLQLGTRHARVCTAVPPSDEQKGRLEADLIAKFGDDLTIEFAVDPELIGGMRVQVGSNVWDGSVRARLNELTR